MVASAVAILRAFYTRHQPRMKKAPRLLPLTHILPPPATVIPQPIVDRRLPCPTILPPLLPPPLIHSSPPHLLHLRDVLLLDAADVFDGQLAPLVHGRKVVAVRLSHQSATSLGAREGGGEGGGRGCQDEEEDERRLECNPRDATPSQRVTDYNIDIRSETLKLANMDRSTPHPPHLPHTHTESECLQLGAEPKHANLQRHELVGGHDRGAGALGGGSEGWGGKGKGGKES